MRTALLLLLAASPAFAAYEDMGFGARDRALGGAFTAVADDASAAAYNPAGLAAQRDGQAALGWSRRRQNPTGEARTESIEGAAVIPWDIDELSGTAGILGRRVELQDFSQDKELALSYGLRGPRRSDSSRLDMGATLKIQQRAALGNPATRRSLGGDAGLLYRRGIDSVGLSVLNIGSPDQSLAGVEDRAAMAVKAGYAQRTPGVLFCADATYRSRAAGHPGATTAAAGLERAWSARMGTVALRAGLALGNRSKEVTAGLGWQAFGLRLDYAVIAPLRRAPAGHAVTLGYKFGAGDPVAQYEQMLNREIQNQRELAEVLNRLETEVALLKHDLEQTQAALEAAKQESAAKDKNDSSRAVIDNLKVKNSELEQRLSRVRGELNRAAQPNFEGAFRLDWAAYQKLKASGAPRAALKVELERLLHLYRDKGLDVSEVRQELLQLSN